MNLYAETSAVLAWLFGEAEGRDVGRLLAESEIVLASELTFMEVDRLLVRREATGHLSEAARLGIRSMLSSTSAAWEVLGLVPDVLERARRRFPIEPVRTLDAIHLASALACREAAPGLGFLSLDRRCRANAAKLGLRVLPGLGLEVKEPSARRPAPHRTGTARKK